MGVSSEVGIMARLTGRQQQIVRQLAAGKSQKEIARQLGISYSTVRNHMRQARDRTDCRSSIELAVKADRELRTLG
jgi:two-component system nitrate/nitrite response regulator NarP